jgi:hypothetical protein
MKLAEWSHIIIQMIVVVKGFRDQFLLPKPSFDNKNDTLLLPFCFQ